MSRKLEDNFECSERKPTNNYRFLEDLDIYIGVGAAVYVLSNDLRMSLLSMGASFFLNENLK